jgi:uncharacterized coiled-coil protein SlyX
MAVADEVRFVKLELNVASNIEQLETFEERLKALELNHSEQVSILAKLGQTVETLASTVTTLSQLTRELDKGQEVFKARFNITIAILSTIGVAVIAGVVKILFFGGA